jgi:drug/metabolite transporter (DMT)-like permease
MSPLVVGLLITAAALHATWNAILRSGADRLWSITIISAVAGLVALPIGLALPTPAPASWPYLALSAVLQIGYCLSLVRAYRDGHLAHVYPIARGTAPLLVTIGAAAFAGERLGLASMAGVLLVSVGIMILGLGRDRPDPRSTAAALVTGAFIASYMVTDGVGARLSQHAISYAAWQAVSQGSLMVLVYWLIRHTPPRAPRGRPGAQVLLAAIFGLVGYSVVIWAMSLSPMGQVSALRETRILFAAVIGAIFLGEPLNPRRILGGIVITSGAICLSAC